MRFLPVSLTNDSGECRSGLFDAHEIGTAHPWQSGAQDIEGEARCLTQKGRMAKKPQSGQRLCHGRGGRGCVDCPR